MSKQVITRVEEFLGFDQSSNRALHGLVIVTWKDEVTGSLFITKHPPEITTEEALKTLPGTAVPDSHAYPPWADDITEAPTPLPPNHFIKMPDVMDYDATSACAERFAVEARLMEKLRSVPHQNIVKYYGCVRRGSYIGGICLHKYVCTLSDVLYGKAPSDRMPRFDPESVILDIRAGLEHTHKLGIVHNDINPANIMLDEDGRAVIIDFGMSGEPDLVTFGGTPGWFKNRTGRRFENDEEGFRLVQGVLRNELPNPPYEPFED